MLTDKNNLIETIDSISWFLFYKMEPPDDLMKCLKALATVREMLLKEEAVQVNPPGTAYKTTWSCGKCSYPLSPDWVACPSCGKAVKWDAAD